MISLETEKITKNELEKINEDDLLFITTPGRMGDVDGSTFVVKQGKDYKKYRVGGWYYQDENTEITIQDMFKKFPKWKECWNNWTDPNAEGKYKYINMGFGNGLCVDRDIYDKFYPYLLEEVKKNDMYDGRDDYNPCINYPSWGPALERMISDMKES